MSNAEDELTAQHLRNQLREMNLSTIEEKFMEHIDSLTAKVDSILKSIGSLAIDLRGMEQWKTSTEDSLERGQVKFDDHEARLRTVEMQATQASQITKLEAASVAFADRLRFAEQEISKGKLISTIIGTICGIVGTGVLGLLFKMFSGGK